MRWLLITHALYIQDGDTPEACLLLASTAYCNSYITHDTEWMLKTCCNDPQQVKQHTPCAPPLAPSCICASACGVPHVRLLAVVLFCCHSEVAACPQPHMLLDAVVALSLRRQCTNARVTRWLSRPSGPTMKHSSTEWAVGTNTRRPSSSTAL